MPILEKIGSELALNMKLENRAQFLRFFDLFRFFSGKSCSYLFAGRFLLV
jgi:hypothetical protein